MCFYFSFVYECLFFVAYIQYFCKSMMWLWTSSGCPCGLCVRGPVIFFDRIHTWEDTKVTTWVLCVCIHPQAHILYIYTPYTPFLILSLQISLSLSEVWSLDAFCCQGLLSFTLDCTPTHSSSFAFFLFLIFYLLPFLNVFPFADYLLAFIGT